MVSHASRIEARAIPSLAAVVRLILSILAILIPLILDRLS
jgi:hypothetical protein